MSSLRLGDDGTVWRAAAMPRRARGRPASTRLGRPQPCLTVPLLCSAGGGRFQVERLHQIQRRLAQAQVMQLGPEVNDIALLGTCLVEAVEDVVTQVDAERAAAGVLLPRPRS